jgi:hypothetical protein
MLSSFDDSFCDEEGVAVLLVVVREFDHRGKKGRFGLVLVFLRLDSSR